MKKLMVMLVLLTLAFGSKADTLIWEPFDPDNSGVELGDETFDDYKHLIAIYNGDYTIQVKIGWEVVCEFVEETIDYVLNNIVKDNFSTDEQYEHYKVFFEEKIREFKANYESGVAYMNAYFGVEEFFVDVDEEFGVVNK